MKQDGLFKIKIYISSSFLVFCVTVTQECQLLPIGFWYFSSWLIIFSGNYQDHDQGLQAKPAAQAVNKCILKREQIAIMKGGLARWKHGVMVKGPAQWETVDDGPVEPVPFEVFHAQNCDRGVEKMQPGQPDNQPE